MPILGAIGGASSRGLGQFNGNRTSPIAGYHLWLDADNASSFTYSSGSVVSQWTDRSSNAFTFTTATTSNQPGRTGTKNGKATVVFDGTNDYLKSTAPASTWKYLHDSSGSTIFVVLKINETATATTQKPEALSTVNGGPGFSLRIDEYFSPISIEAVVDDGVSGTYCNNSKEVPNTEYNIYTYKIDPNNATNSNKLVAYQNNGSALAPDFVYNWTAASTADPSSTLLLGTGSDAGLIGSPEYVFAGEFAEIITYKSLLSDSDIVANINYLKAKWGIQPLLNFKQYI